MKQSESFYYEGKIAEQIGISRSEIRNIRDKALDEKKHWRQIGRDIVYLGSGLKKFLSYLGAELETADLKNCLVPLREKRKGLAPQQEPRKGAVELTVKRCFPNPKLLLATDADGNEVRVRVNRNSNFKTKMKLHAERIGDGLYKLVGRCPRFPGRY